MEYIAVAVIVIAFTVAWNGKDWINSYWEGKTKANHENRLAAEANAKEAEAKLALARINGSSPAIRP